MTGMDGYSSNRYTLTKLMFRLLPVQVLLALITAVNSMISTYFASNFIGADAMSVVGLANPFTMLQGALSTVLVAGATILCGKFIGQNEEDRLHANYSLSMILSAVIGLLFSAFYVVVGAFDLGGFITNDTALRPLFNRYLLGCAVGVLPMFAGNILTGFLSFENKTRRTATAGIVCFISNLVFAYLFVCVAKLDVLGLSLASSLSLWVFFLTEAQYFVTGKSFVHFRMKALSFKAGFEILTTGWTGGLSYAYQAVRALIVNWLLITYVGSVGVSAMATADNLLRIFWAIPSGMLAVSRMMISVSAGEEDRQTMADVMRVMLRRYVPLMACVSALLIAFAVPLTTIFYQDKAAEVFNLTVWGVRIMPLCMPLSIICMHFVCYGQTMKKPVLVQILSALDGVVCVAGFTALLIRPVGMNSVYIAMVLNGVTTTLTIIIYAWVQRKRFPAVMDDLLVIPDDFGASADERMDLSVTGIEQVVEVAREVQEFCTSRGIDERRSYLSGLAMEEMAGNIVEHGFTKDSKKHTIDLRIVHKDDDVIMRMRDDCVPFNPGERLKLVSNDEKMKNIGLRMVYGIAQDIQYQNILGLNVLTLRM